MLGSRAHRLVTRLAPKTVKISTRNTVIVKRIHKPPLVTTTDYTGKVSKKAIDESVVMTEDCKYMVYELVEKEQEEKKMKFILLKNVDDYGVKGQIISEVSTLANKDLLLTGLAVYYNEENLKKYADIIIPEETKMVSSEQVKELIKKWSKRCLDVCMTMDNDWTLENWHIRASLRKHGLWVEHDDITIPGGTISGPDLSLENKEFIAIVTINNFDKLKIRCRLHHISKNPMKKIELKSWYFYQAEPIFEHERQELLDMNRPPPSKRLREMKSMEKNMEQYNQWKVDRIQRIRNY